MTELIARITCPECGHAATETMPTDSCVFFYACLGFIGTVLKPKPNDCCVFCSYADQPCPIVQATKNCCDSKPTTVRLLRQVMGWSKLREDDTENQIVCCRGIACPAWDARAFVFRASATAGRERE